MEATAPDACTVPRLALTVREIAESINMPSTHVYQAIKSGELEASQLKTRYLATPKAVNDWLRKLAVKTPANSNIYPAVRGLQIFGIDPYVVAVRCDISNALAVSWWAGKAQPDEPHSSTLWKLLHIAYGHAVRILDAQLDSGVPVRPPEELVNTAMAIRTVAVLLMDAGYEVELDDSDA